MARRSVRRHLGRSLLVVALVAVPIAGATAVDVVLRSLYHPDRAASRHMGPADALAVVTPHERLDGWQPTAGHFTHPSGTGERPAATFELDAVLPPGARAVPAGVDYDVRLQAHGRPAGGQPAGAVVRISALGDELVTGEVRLRSGTMPAGRTEVLVTGALAERLDLLDGDGKLAPGALLRVEHGPVVGVSGLAVVPTCLSCEHVVAARESVMARHVTDERPRATATLVHVDGAQHYLVDLPDGTDVDALWRRLAGHGVALVPREVYLEPHRYRDPSAGGDLAGIQAAGAVALIAGFGVLQVVLLAGAAFAVGARRQVRELGLVMASGGTPRQVRRVVLAQGAVLGAAGALAGILAGVLLALATRPLWQRAFDELVDGWRAGWAEVVAVAVVGVTAGLAASYLPARGAARMRPVDALAERFRSSPMTARLPVAGVALLAGGAGGALLTGLATGQTFRDYARRLDEAAGTGVWVQQPSTGLAVTVQVLGAAAAVAGLALLVPWLLSTMARAGHRLPLAARLAVRDAARHRHRTVPAITAVMVVVATAVGLVFSLAGMERADTLRYRPLLPAGMAHVAARDLPPGAVGPGAPAGGPGAPADAIAAATAAAARLDGAEAVALSSPVFVAPGGSTEASAPATVLPSQRARDECTSEVGAERVAMPGDCNFTFARLAVADPTVLAAALGTRPEPDLLAALRDGAVVVFHDWFLDRDGMVALERWDDESGTVTEALLLPGYLASRERAYALLPDAFVAAGTVRALPALGTVEGAVLVTYPPDAPEEDLEAAADIARSHGADWSVESGPPATTGALATALTAIAGFVTLVGVAVSVALSAAEGRPDLATLAAVGARPRVRRALAGVQALVVAGTGTLLGIPLGAYFAALTFPMTGSPDFVVPWPALAVTGVVVPVFGIAVAALATPGRFTMVRRIA